VIAHEVGHHVQNLLASAKKMEQTRSRVSKVDTTAQRAPELQADRRLG
jgi:predicted metalloprotease